MAVTSTERFSVTLATAAMAQGAKRLTFCNSNYHPLGNSLRAAQRIAKRQGIVLETLVLAPRFICDVQEYGLGHFESPDFDRMIFMLNRSEAEAYLAHLTIRDRITKDERQAYEMVARGFLDNYEAGLRAYQDGITHPWSARARECSRP